MSALSPRPGLMDIAPYVGGDSRLQGDGPVIKLSSNEAAFGPNPKALDAFHAAGANLHRYPDIASADLRAAIAEVYGLAAERIVCGCGSDEFFITLCQAYAGPGDEVLYPQHGFLMYPIVAKSVGATPVTAPEVNLTADVDNLLAAVTDKTRIVFIANPGNPTGTYVSAQELARLRDGLADDVLLVIDSAYAEFVTADDYSAGAELVARYDNVVMTRTFSKIYALGGARVGWAYCPIDVIGVINRIRNPFNLATSSQAAATAAVRDVDFTAKCCDHNRQWLAWITAELRALGLDVTDSVTNFVLVRFASEGEKTAEEADRYLRSKRIIVRRVTSYGLPDCLRITIGLEDEMRAVAAALKEFML